MEEVRHGMVEMTPINQENEKCGEGEDEKGFQEEDDFKQKSSLICLLYRNDDSQWGRA
jgi:hypothetical protein